MILDKINTVISSADSVLKGKEQQVKLVMCNILAKGHTLIEDAPGVGKTTLVKFIGKSLGLNLSRIQFTNDILPSDILGTSIFNKEQNEFTFHKGPIFGELILADELNRAPPKTQSALLQVMEERSISIEGKDFSFPEYFSVIATQNPNIQIGTFDLPESQLDRFSLKLAMGYPSKKSTIELLKNIDSHTRLQDLPVILTQAELLEAQSLVQQIHIEDSLYENIYSLLELSRNDSQYTSLSNRSAQDIVSVTKSWAFLNGRDYALPDDISFIFPYVAGHRLTHSENSDIQLEHKLANQILESTK